MCNSFRRRHSKVNCQRLTILHTTVSSCIRCFWKPSWTLNRSWLVTVCPILTSKIIWLLRSKHWWSVCTIQHCRSSNCRFVIWTAASSVRKKQCISGMKVSRGWPRLGWQEQAEKDLVRMEQWIKDAECELLIVCFYLICVAKSMRHGVHSPSNDGRRTYFAIVGFSFQYYIWLLYFNFYVCLSH